MFCQGLDLEFGTCSTTRIEGGACCFQDRREAERLLVEALMSSEDGFSLKTCEQTWPALFRASSVWRKCLVSNVKVPGNCNVL